MLGVIGWYYRGNYFMLTWVILVNVLIYTLITFIMAGKRAKQYKEVSDLEQIYVDKVSDSL